MPLAQTQPNPPSSSDNATPAAGSEPSYQRYIVAPEFSDTVMELSKSKFGLMEGSWLPGEDSTTVARRQAKEVFSINRKQLANDAQAFFAQLPPAAPRPPLPEIRPGTSLSEALPLLLEHSSGLAFGESHHSSESKRLLIDLMPALYQQGVRTLYMEHVLSDVHQSDLDAFCASETAPMPQRLADYLREQDKGHMRFTEPTPYTFQRVYEEARANRLQIVAIDCLASYFIKHVTGFNSRIAIMNYYASLVINHRQSLPDSGKWVALMGNAHTNQLETVPGVAELCQGTGIRIDINPRGIGLDYGMELKEALGNRKFLVKADLVANNQPVVTEAMLNAALKQSGDFLIRSLPSDNGYELRHRSRQGEIVVTAVQHDGEQIYLSRPSWSEVDQTRYPSVQALCAALTRFGLNNVWQGFEPQLPPEPASPPPLPEPESLGLTAAARQRRQDWLLYLALFASPGERARFQAGKQQESAILERLDLTSASSFTLGNALLARRELLTLEECGALLAAMDHKQAMQVRRLIHAWQTSMASLGGSEIQQIGQNLYLTASERQLGVCSALSAQVSAAWMLDVAAEPYRNQHSGSDAQSNTHIERYLDHLQTAIDEPDSDPARLFGLGLQQWSLNEESARFGQQSAQSGLTLPGIQLQLETATSAAAFELSQGQHAMAVGVNPVGVSRRFFIADPNFGYAEFLSSADFARALALHMQLLTQLTDSAQAEPSYFTLRQYRKDLPDCALLPDRAGKLALSLGDLGRSEELLQRYNRNQPLASDRQFNRLQKQLDIESYRIQFAPPLGKRTSQQLHVFLRRVFVRHQAPSFALADNAKILDIRFKGHLAWVAIDAGNGLVHPEFAIDGRRFPDDLVVLRKYQDFIDRVHSQPSVLKRWLQRSPRLEMDRTYLMAALPQQPERLAQILEVLHSATTHR